MEQELASGSRAGRLKFLDSGHTLVAGLPLKHQPVFPGQVDSTVHVENTHVGWGGGVSTDEEWHGGGGWCGHSPQTESRVLQCGDLSVKDEGAAR